MGENHAERASHLVGENQEPRASQDRKMCLTARLGRGSLAGVMNAEAAVLTIHKQDPQGSPSVHVPRVVSVFITPGGLSL